MKRIYQKPHSLYIRLHAEGHLLSASTDPKIKSGTGTLDGTNAMTNKRNPIWYTQEEDNTEE